MKVLDHAAGVMEEWRPGVVTRMRVSAAVGAAQLTIFEQWVSPGRGPPDHRHSVEEVLTVLVGSAEVWVGNDRKVVEAGFSVVVPAGRRHGFSNVGSGELHMLATLAAPVFEAQYEDGHESPRRWLLVSEDG